MFNKSFAIGLMVLGFLLMTYSIASTNAITGDVTLAYDNPGLKVQWIMLCTSAIIIVVAFILLFFKNKKEIQPRDGHSDVPHLS